MPTITQQKDLDAFCAKFKGHDYLAIDTEFLRERTYYPKLCLIQMAGDGIEPTCIDPLANEIDLTPVFDLMADESIIKVFHAARQDLEIFFHLNKHIPAPIFDTQIAAMVCGYGDQISYANLVQQIIGAGIEKTAQYTDWSRRPLSEKQITYARTDVDGLRAVYVSLSNQLKKQNREKWVREEMEILSDPNTYAPHPETAWERIKIRTDKPENLAILRELAAWREEEARTRDVPRGRLLKDDALADIAMYKPVAIDGLSRIRALPKDWHKGEKAKTILSLVQKGLNCPPADRPKPKKRTPLPKNLQPALEMLKMLLKISCAEGGVVPKLIATPQDLESIVMGKTHDILALKGWRYDVFGHEAQDLLDGKLALYIEKGRIKRFHLDEQMKG